MTGRSARLLTAAVVSLLVATSGTAAFASGTASVSPSADQLSSGALPDAAATAPTPEATGPVDGNGTTIVTDGEELVLDVAPNQTIRGETRLEPGTELHLNVEGDTFLKSQRTTVTDRGTFNATFDMSDVGEQNVEIRVYRDETVLAETAGRVTCSGGCETEATDSDGGNLDSGDGPAVQAITEVNQNRTASIKVLFGEAETVTISIGGPDVNYVVNGTVTDRDGDGHATVLFHTNRAGTDAPTLGVVDDGGTRVVETSAETSLDSPLAPASYDVRLFAGPNASGDAAAVGTVIVFEEATESDGQAGASTSTTSTTLGTVAGDDANGSETGDSGDQFLGGVGMIAAGGVLAVVGIGVVLGLFRN
ncbi:BGTF surface domain-containing protein [Halorussus aquaticus]|uniref:BGTF surface domain-containing protein n=1 Tax=Halorussus aquaticus TaxID=2953748 RepID=A0ABD5Q2N7_9EURY|nr:BGTF surface domain-containing protein [Halorussus aquaticus]